MIQIYLINITVKKKKIGESLCEILLTSNNPENILEVSKIYFDLADEFIKNNLLLHQAKKFILLGLLADFANDDIVKVKMDLEKYSRIDYKFESSREGIFVLQLMGAFESFDSEKISMLCAELDKIIPLDNVQVNLLTRIKNLIDNGFGNDNMGNINNNDELDLA